MSKIFLQNLSRFDRSTGFNFWANWILYGCMLRSSLMEDVDHASNSDFAPLQVIVLLLRLDDGVGFMDKLDS